MKRVIVLIISLYILGYGLVVHSMVPFALKYISTDGLVCVSPHIDYILFVVPILFLAMFSVSLIKKIQFKWQTFCGYITVVIMLFYAKGTYESIIVNVTFLCMCIMSLGLNIWNHFNLALHTTDKASFISFCFFNVSLKKKISIIIVCILLVGINFAYILAPKDWIYLYVPAGQHIQQSYQMDNYIIETETQVENIGVFWDYGAYSDGGWKFEAVAPGTVHVTLLNKQAYDGEISYEDVILTIDENLKIQYKYNIAYYFDIYGFNIFVITNACLIVLITCVKSKNKN